MAILRASEIREMGAEELDDKLTQLHNDLMKIRGVLASGGIPEHVGRMKETRKTIARINTIKNAKARDAKTAVELKEQKKQ
jgi:large subunit ribosomal protein L29